MSNHKAWIHLIRPTVLAKQLSPTAVVQMEDALLEGKAEAEEIQRLGEEVGAVAGRLCLTDLHPLDLRRLEHRTQDVNLTGVQPEMLSWIRFGPSPRPRSSPLGPWCSSGSSSTGTSAESVVGTARHPQWVNFCPVAMPAR